MSGSTLNECATNDCAPNPLFISVDLDGCGIWATGLLSTTRVLEFCTYWGNIRIYKIPNGIGTVTKWLWENFHLPVFAWYTIY